MSASWSWILAVGAVAALADPAAAQRLDERVRAAPDGAVRFSYPAREDVCGHANGVYSHGVRGDGDWRPWCEPGPVRVQLEKDGRAIARLRAHVGGDWASRDRVTDLGDVDAADASGFLLDLVPGARADVAEDAIDAAVLADAPDPWERLLRFARDRALASDVREQAVFWLGQSAAREATAGLDAMIASDETTELQKAAVFALSQRDEPERIDRLIRVARTHRNPEVVKASLFWLADSEDERVVDFFAEILVE